MTMSSKNFSQNFSRSISIGFLATLFSLQALIPSTSHAIPYQGPTPSPSPVPTLGCYVGLPQNRTFPQQAGLTGNASGGVYPYRFAWTAPAGASITSASGANAVASFSAEGEYIFTLTCQDARGTVATNNVKVSVSSAFSCNAGNDQTLALPNTAALNAVGYGGRAPYAFQWTSPEGALLNNRRNLETVATFTAGAAKYNFTLKCIDANGAQFADQKSIDVTPPITKAASIALFANMNNHTTLKVDPATNSYVKTFFESDGAYDVALSLDGQTYYRAGDFGRSLEARNANTGALLFSVDLGIGNYSSPYALAMSPDGKFVYVANSFTHNVTVVNLVSRTAVANIPVGNTPQGLAVSPDGSFVYVANAYSDSISVIDTSLNAVTNTIQVGHRPSGITISPNGSFVYVSHIYGITVGDINNISVISTSSNRVVKTLVLGVYGGVAYTARPTSLAVSPDSTRLYAASKDSRIWSYDLVNNRLLPAVLLGPDSFTTDPFSIRLTPDGKFAYISNLSTFGGTGGDGSISVMDTRTFTIIKNISTYYAPYGIAIR